MIHKKIKEDIQRCWKIEKLSEQRAKLVSEYSMSSSEIYSEQLNEIEASAQYLGILAIMQIRIPSQFNV